MRHVTVVRNAAAELKTVTRHVMPRDDGKSVAKRLEAIL